MLERRAELDENWRRARAHMPLERLLAPMPTSDFPIVDVLRLRPLEGHRLWLRFTDGSEGVRDLSDVIAEGGVMVQSWGTQSELPPPKSRKL
jgi:hypothetical protein